eukprot:TRINITY_DN15170_c0_g1_i1.p1 TRINITY_DN15170_c0_g1~~TRINITY_DN15170_c0_g1_i1.p1  ORF type:complete len:784 (+),score=188.70 TRINITY_DN15170_c0_g1_i1:76-2427(+)
MKNPNTAHLSNVSGAETRIVVSGADSPRGGSGAHNMDLDVVQGVKNGNNHSNHNSSHHNNHNNTSNHHQNNHHHHHSRGNSTPRNGVKSVENLSVSQVDSVRSSNSSLTKSETSGCGGGESPVVSVLKPSSGAATTPRATSAHTKKVSISDAVVRREHAMVSPGSGGGSTTSGTDRVIHRTSLIQVSSEKRAKKVRFFINGDKFFKGAVIAVSNEKFRTFDKLLEHLTRIMCTQVTLPNGVRYIFSLEGRQLQDIDTIQTGDSYVCSSTTGFKKLDYHALAEEDHTWNRVKRETYYLGMRTTSSGHCKRDNFRMAGHSKSFGQTKTTSTDSEPKVYIKPRIITVLRSGTRPRKAVRVLLNNRNTRSLDMVLADLTNTVKLDTGAVRKIYTLDGHPVNSLLDLKDEEVFIAYGVDKCSPDDFDLDLIEFRNVQAILKSQKLDLKYEKFAHMSPKSSRKKFLLSRVVRSRRATSKSRQNGGIGAAGGLKNGNSFHNIEDIQEDTDSYPNEVTDKYHIRQIIGHGNFAVVRLCYTKDKKREFAAKVIDKARCQGKEHMIESEIAILSSVDHPNIIKLQEVFDFPDEKYLIMEFVSGGDLFDAIAADIKYCESVARDMVKDLADALQYLHDRMICHRDIKPENLLVIDKQLTKSLKLADFGLAVTVREPLFTVCGTPTYVAPEILAETGYGVKVDIWAIGVILYILLCGYPPFSSRSNNQEELFDQILSGLFEFNSPDWDPVSYPAKELISWSLVVDPLQRYSAKEILSHPWMLDRKSSSPNPLPCP